jgi:hypothetical protein
MMRNASHAEWCFFQTELIASLGNASMLETELYEGRSLRQICLIYMALINTGEIYTGILSTELSNECTVCILRNNVDCFILLWGPYSIIISLFLSKMKITFIKVCDTCNCKSS